MAAGLLRLLAGGFLIAGAALGLAHGLGGSLALPFRCLALRLGTGTRLFFHFADQLFDGLAVVGFTLALAAGAFLGCRAGLLVVLLAAGLLPAGLVTGICGLVGSVGLAGILRLAAAAGLRLAAVALLLLAAFLLFGFFLIRVFLIFVLLILTAGIGWLRVGLIARRLRLRRHWRLGFFGRLRSGFAWLLVGGGRIFCVGSWGRRFVVAERFRLRRFAGARGWFFTRRSSRDDERCIRRCARRWARGGR